MARRSYATRIRNRIAELERQVRMLSEELSELRTAERVLSRLGPEDDDDDARSTTRKEPTVADKIAETLRVVEEATTNELLDLLQTDWRNDLTINTVSTTLNRMKANRRVRYDAGQRKWSLQLETEEDDNEEGPDSGLFGPSRTDDGGGEAGASGTGYDVSPRGSTPPASTSVSADEADTSSNESSKGRKPSPFD